MSYKPEVIADDSGTWAGNALCFETEREAEIWVRDLSFRWLAVRETRVVESDDPVSHKMVEIGDHVWQLQSAS
jgi:hypothetical protein